MKRKYFVRQVPNSPVSTVNISGPFVVIARNPLHAARLVRHKWPGYLGNHVSVETHALSVIECGDMVSLAFISDRRGLVLPNVTRHYS
jgi:hypothetical protein